MNSFFLRACGNNCEASASWLAEASPIFVALLHSRAGGHFQQLNQFCVRPGWRKFEGRLAAFVSGVEVSSFCQQSFDDFDMAVFCRRHSPRRMPSLTNFVKTRDSMEGQHNSSRATCFSYSGCVRLVNRINCYTRAAVRTLLQTPVAQRIARGSEPKEVTVNRPRDMRLAQSNVV